MKTSDDRPVAAAEAKDLGAVRALARAAVQGALRERSVQRLRWTDEGLLALEPVASTETPCE